MVYNSGLVFDSGDGIYRLFNNCKVISLPKVKSWLCGSHFYGKSEAGAVLQAAVIARQFSSYGIFPPAPCHGFSPETGPGFFVEGSSAAAALLAQPME